MEILWLGSDLQKYYSGEILKTCAWSRHICERIFLCRRTGLSDGFRLSLYLRPLFSRYAPASADRLRQKNINPDLQNCYCCMITFTERKKMQIHRGIRE
jgi:hypothetical protein